MKFKAGSFQLSKTREFAEYNNRDATTIECFIVYSGKMKISHMGLRDFQVIFGGHWLLRNSGPRIINHQKIKQYV